MTRTERWKERREQLKKEMRDFDEYVEGLEIQHDNFIEIIRELKEKNAALQVDIDILNIKLEMATQNAKS